MSRYCSAPAEALDESGHHRDPVWRLNCKAATRRGLLSSIALAAGFGAAAPAAAKRRCTDSVCIAEVDFDEFQEEAYSEQQRNEWCWAACISMIFSFYGHPVKQKRIVRAVYGADVNMPAMSGYTIARQLNRTWTDDNQERFRSRLKAAFDAQALVVAIDNQMIVNALRNDRPMIFGVGGHAVVLTSAEYQSIPGYIKITRAGVFDPWPGRGARGLTPAEMTPVFQGGALQFIGLPEVTDA